MAVLIPNKHQFLFLDASRGIVALFVIYWHTPQFWSNIPFRHTYLAVDIFFCISGFVIAQAYGEKIYTRTLNLKSFFLIRLIRLYPMYFVGLILGIVAWAMGIITSQQNPVIQILAALVLLPNGVMVGQTLFFFNLPSWSLFFELVINILLAICFLFISFKRLCFILSAFTSCLIVIVIYKVSIR